MITEVTQPVPSIEYPVSTPEEDLRWFVSVQKPRYSDQMESGVFCFVARLSIKGKSIKDLTPSLMRRLRALINTPVHMYRNGRLKRL